MKPPTLKKLRDIKGRVRDLRSSFAVQIKASKQKPETLANPDDRLIPRVTALVIREGNWLVRLAQHVAEKGGVELDKDDGLTVDLAREFFSELADVHADEIKKNGFIYRLDGEFVTYMEKLVLLVEKVDAQIKAKIAAVATFDDDEGDDADLEAEIAAEMTS